jgi:hypothetical protein
LTLIEAVIAVFGFLQNKLEGCAMRGKAWGSLTLLLLILLAACAVWIGKSTDHSQLRWQYIAVTAILVALCIVAGVLVNGRLEGVLISDRNRMSLARVQWVAWMIVLLGAYFVEAVWNVAHSFSFPEMQTESFGLFGIISGSSIVSSLIVDAKMRPPVVPSGQPQAVQPQAVQPQAVQPQAVQPQAVQPQAVQPMADGDHPGHKGSMDINYKVAEAGWADLYLGEEVANRYVVDVSRLQKLIVTVLLVLAYLIYLWKGFSPSGSGQLEMSAVDRTFLSLLGISHGAYLASKATPKTPC